MQGEGLERLLVKGKKEGQVDEVDGDPYRYFLLAGTSRPYPDDTFYSVGRVPRKLLMKYLGVKMYLVRIKEPPLQVNYNVKYDQSKMHMFSRLKKLNLKTGDRIYISDKKMRFLMLLSQHKCSELQKYREIKLVQSLKVNLKSAPKVSEFCLLTLRGCDCHGQYFLLALCIRDLVDDRNQNW